jgi:hypothetical protein
MKELRGRGHVDNDSCCVHHPGLQNKQNLLSMWAKSALIAAKCENKLVLETEGLNKQF